MKAVMNYLIGLCFTIFQLTSVFAGTPIKVTFWSNTSGVPDTLHATSTVQIRGSGSVLTWDNNSPARMTNAFGEYWKSTVLFNAGDTVQYQYFTNVKSNITASDSGWEGPISDWGNGKRRLIVGQKDTILPLEYVNGFQNPATQWEAPFATEKKDTFVCYLRVNMQSLPDFNPSSMKVGVRGSFAASNWTTSVIMTPEPPHPNPGQNSYDASHFYTISIYWPKHILDSASTYEGKVMRYKFVIHRLTASPSEDWSLMLYNPVQQFEFAMPKRDTVPLWTWWEIRPPFPYHVDTINTTFPNSCELSQNYPNPFNPSTTISFSIPHASQVSLKIFNLLGKEITTLVSEKLVAGTYKKNWDATGFPASFYFCRLQVDNYIETKKLVLLK